MNKVLIIGGPTATGKTDLALQIAKELPADLVSADSRQVYQGMDIGTGKDIPPDYQKKLDNYSNGSTNIWGYDLVKPSEEFSLGHYIRFGQKAIREIWNQNKLPVVVGGTGLYIHGVLHPPTTAAVPQDQAIRNSLETASLKELQKRLQELDPHKFTQMNQSDQQNPRRLVRAIEVAEYVNKHPNHQPLQPLMADTLKLGLTAPLEYLDQKIEKRVDFRLENGMIEEVKTLHLQDLDDRLPSVNTLGYDQIIDYRAGRKTKQEARNDWITAEKQYARRQLTWFKKQPNIKWFDVTSKDYMKTVVGLVASWYSETK